MNDFSDLENAILQLKGFAAGLLALESAISKVKSISNDLPILENKRSSLVADIVNLETSKRGLEAKIKELESESRGISERVIREAQEAEKRKEEEIRRIEEEKKAVLASMAVSYQKAVEQMEADYEKKRDLINQAIKALNEEKIALESKVKDLKEEIAKLREKLN